MINQIVILGLTTAIGIVGYFVKNMFNLMQEHMVQLKVQTELNRNIQKDMEKITQDVTTLSEKQHQHEVEIAVLKEK